MAAILVISFSGSASSGTDGADNQGAVRSAAVGHRAAPDQCPSARRAVRFYGRRLAQWRERMGAPVVNSSRTAPRHGCPRYLAKVLQRKAYAARKAYHRYVSYHWHWWKWMPDKWQRVGACETGYGRRPGSFTWDSGTYVSFAGIIRSGYADFAHRLGLMSWDETVARRGRPPTPREQVLVATALQAQYGWGAWGCGGA